MADKKIALVPAYEPGDTLLPLLRQLREAGFATLVVDDGSGAAYQNLFDAAREYADVYSYLPNRGKGFALKKGFSLLAERFGPDATVVTSDPAPRRISATEWQTARSSSATSTRSPESGPAVAASLRGRTRGATGLSGPLLLRSVICVPGRYSRVP